MDRSLRLASAAVGFLAALLCAAASQAGPLVQVIGYHATYNVAIDDVPQGKEKGPFGSPGTDCAIQSEVVSDWPVESKLDIWRSFQLSAVATGVEVLMAIDNDAELWINGKLIGSVVHEGCATKWTHFDVSDGDLQVGKNTILVKAVDRGGYSFLGLRVRAVVK